MAASALEAESVRRDFPALAREVNGHPLTYLDNAATAQKPAVVLETLAHIYRTCASNVHRGIHTLSEEATAAYEAARDRVAALIGAPDRRGVIFTRNATEAINLVAYSWGRATLRPGDRIVVTELEHHSNLLPWQVLTREVGAELAFIPLDGQGRLALEALDALLDGPVRLVAFSHVSNVLGTIAPAREIIARAHAAGALTLVDAAQSVPHMPVDAGALECDFLAFSGHKLGGPTGAGVLFGRPELLEAMPPFLVGGGMVRHVERSRAIWDDLPHKFEAGTPPVAEAVALGAAVDYLRAVGLERIWAHEQALTRLAMEGLAQVPGVRVPGPPAQERAGVVAFTLAGVHPHDVAAALDLHGIAVRAGYHCAEVLHECLGLGPTVRASFHLYNTAADVERLVAALAGVRALFAEVTDDHSLS